MRPVEGANGAHDPERLILDGQQRITSLFQSLHRDEPVLSQDVRKNPMSGWFYMDMEAAVADPGAREDAIHFVPADRVRRNFRGQSVLDLSSSEKEYASGMFPLNKVFDYNPWSVADGRRQRWRVFPERGSGREAVGQRATPRREHLHHGLF